MSYFLSIDQAIENGEREKKRLVHNDQQLYIYRDWQGLNATNSWWYNHDVARMENVEDKLCPDCYFLDIDTNVAMTTTYDTEAAVDGSRFEYNVLSKTPITLYFLLYFTDMKDFLAKKRDIQTYFAAKARFVIASSYFPNIHAAGYFNKLEIKMPQDGAHHVQFQVILDNACGFWFTNNSAILLKYWDDSTARDLGYPVGEKPDFMLHEGENHIYIPGDQTIKASSPVQQLNVDMEGCGQDISIENKTTNTTLSAKSTDDTKLALSMRFENLDLVTGSAKEGTLKHLNGASSAVDFWLDPGDNDIVLHNITSAFIDASFCFATL